jgi:signal transduction histidine kinase
MTWLSFVAAMADVSREQVRRNAELEQQVSEVLWRMDTKLAPLLAGEVAISPERFLSNGNFSEPPPKYVRLRFSVSADDTWHTPQTIQQVVKPVREPTETNLLDQLASHTDFSQLEALLPVTEIPQVLAQSTEENQQSYLNNTLDLNPPTEKQFGKVAKDFEDRNLRYQSAAQQQVEQQRGGAPTDALQQAFAAPIREGVSQPVWIDGQLLLARRVQQADVSYVVGSWLDWNYLEKFLLTEAIDLLPGATLQSVEDLTNPPLSQMLAGLPVQLNPGKRVVVTQVSSLMKWALAAGWAALAIAVAAVAVLFWGVLALSERRAAFVSSVTHELRSPLTTFRLYADMLARDMVPDAQRRHEYHETLRREAERLTHLVENVLSYARLERGRVPRRSETLSAAELVARFENRLRNRAEEAGFNWEVHFSEDAANARLRTDVGAVEQILFNLVDNAAKYAVAAADRRIELRIEKSDRQLALRVRDHGSGFSEPQRTRRPQPFSKTSEEAAATAPGVGLGLALCRRLAKELGAALNIASTANGATATLLLPTE